MAERQVASRQIDTETTPKYQMVDDDTFKDVVDPTRSEEQHV